MMAGIRHCTLPAGGASESSFPDERNRIESRVRRDAGSKARALSMSMPARQGAGAAVEFFALRLNFSA